ncbi:choice-of-anchor D domain-containing protein [Wenzhouxiangella sp. EGI_FJ10305]|uniref:choice-of-anchor D domain-containing protein n=1 Tax=Wenzhouxiangella sp. EGI_FJ10305 TaxID=3243768 RepID=UPI0035E0782F
MTEWNIFRRVLLAGVLVLASAQASGAVFTVTNNADSGAGSLRQMVLDANAAAGQDEINFDPGLGTITLTSGQIEVTDSLIIRGPTDRQAISGNECSRIFKVTAGVEFENLRLIDGIDSATCGSISGDGSGGAVHISAAPAAFSNCEISASRAERPVAGVSNARGGGVYSAGPVTIQNSAISGNTVAGVNDSSLPFPAGGGVYARSIQVRDSVIERNQISVEDGFGAGLSAGTTSVVNSRVSENVASGLRSRGGGIWGGIVNVENSYIERNQIAAESDGAGIHAVELSVSGSTFFRNIIDGDDGSGDGDDGSGAAIFVGDRLDLVNSTIYQNVAFGESVGSAVSAAGFNAVLNIFNSTILGNSGGTAVLVNLAELNVESTILADNGTPLQQVGGLTDTFNLSNSIFGGPDSGFDTNVDNIFLNDPQMIGFGDWGCAVPAPDECVPMNPPIASGPAVNAGSNPQNLTVDQRGAGFPRVFGVRADIGAFELDVPDLDFQPERLAFGPVSVGNSVVASVTGSSIGSQPLEILDAGLSSEVFEIVSNDCDPATLAPGEDCAIEVRFTPQADGQENTTLGVSWQPAADSPATLQEGIFLEGRGTEPLVSFNPGQVDFGDLRVDTTASVRQIILENSGSESLEIGQVALDGANPDAFTFESDDCSNQTIAPGGSCQLSVSAHPAETGLREARFRIPSNARSSPDSVDLLVNSVEPVLEVSARPLDFGPVFIDQPDTASLTVQNSGTQTLEITGFGSPSEPFAVESNTCMPLPLSLAPGESCVIDFRMEPVQELGAVASSVTITSNADSSPDTITLAATIRPLIIPVMSSFAGAVLILLLMMIGWRRLA